MEVGNGSCGCGCRDRGAIVGEYFVIERICCRQRASRRSQGLAIVIVTPVIMISFHNQLTRNAQ